MREGLGVLGWGLIAGLGVLTCGGWRCWDGADQTGGIELLTSYIATASRLKSEGSFYHTNENRYLILEMVIGVERDSCKIVFVLSSVVLPTS